MPDAELVPLLGNLLIYPTTSTQRQLRLVTCHPLSEPVAGHVAGLPA